MELEKGSISSLGNVPVKEISSGLIYYVIRGRNAWHSTWVTHYFHGCMYSTLQSAKSHAETLRSQGSVIYIRQMPCLVLRSEHSTCLITQINTPDPLSSYSENALTNELPKGRKKIEGALDNYLTNGAPIYGLALSFLPESRFWNYHPSPRDSVIHLVSALAELKIEALPEKGLIAYKSYSNGAGYYLGWSLIGADVKSDGVKKLSAIVNAL